MSITNWINNEYISKPLVVIQKSVIDVVKIFSWYYSPKWVRASSLSRFHEHTHLNTPHTIGLPWTSDKTIAVTSTWQYTTLTLETNIHNPGGIRTHNPTMPAATNPSFRPRDHWDRLKWSITLKHLLYTGIRIKLKPLFILMVLC